MKRATAWLLITISTFALGVAAAFLYLQDDDSQKRQTANAADRVSVSSEKENAEDRIVGFCEMLENREAYDGKIVRLNAVLEFGLEGSWFSDWECTRSKGTTLVFFDRKAVIKPIDDARKPKNGGFLAHSVKVTVTGKFKNEDPKDCCILASSHFEIHRVESATGDS